MIKYLTRTYDLNTFWAHYMFHFSKTDELTYEEYVYNTYKAIHRVKRKHHLFILVLSLLMIIPYTLCYHNVFYPSLNIPSIILSSLFAMLYSISITVLRYMCYPSPIYIYEHWIRKIHVFLYNLQELVFAIITLLIPTMIISGWGQIPIDNTAKFIPLSLSIYFCFLFFVIVGILFDTVCNHVHRRLDIRYSKKLSKNRKR